MIGEIPSSLPSFAWPDLSWPMIRQLTSGALAIAVLGLLEAIAMAKAIAARTRQKLDINQQCLSEGLANLVGSFFQCFPGSGSLTRSAINVQAGAVSQWSGVFAADRGRAHDGAVRGLRTLHPAGGTFWPAAAVGMAARRSQTTDVPFAHDPPGHANRSGDGDLRGRNQYRILHSDWRLPFDCALHSSSCALEMAELTVTPERIIRERMDSDPRCDRILIYGLEGELFFGSAPDLEKHFEAIRAQLDEIPSPPPLSRTGARGELRCASSCCALNGLRNPDAVCAEIFEHFINTMKEAASRCSCAACARILPRSSSPAVCNRRSARRISFTNRRQVGSATLDAVRYAYELLKGDYSAICPRRGDAAKPVLYYMI